MTKKISNKNEPVTPSASTTERQWRVLAELERSKWIGTAQIHEKLKSDGHSVTLRTVQRDLNSLAKRFPLEKNNANPQGWKWTKDAPQESFPNINLSQALAFSMVRENLAHLLPPTILDELQPWFNLADKQLTRNNANQIWLDRVRIEPATQPLVAPEIDITIKNTIYRSVFEQERIEAQYTGANKTEVKDYHLNPIAIIQRGVIIYLLATKVSDPDQTIRTFAMHRFKRAHLLINEPTVLPVDFNLTKHLEDGAMGFTDPILSQLPDKGKHTDVSLTFKWEAAQHLLESKISDKQKVINNNDGTITIQSKLNLTSQLVKWLRGFGKQLVSIHPEVLRQVVYEESSDSNM